MAEAGSALPGLAHDAECGIGRLAALRLAAWFPCGHQAGLPRAEVQSPAALGACRVTTIIRRVQPVRTFGFWMLWLAATSLCLEGADALPGGAAGRENPVSISLERTICYGACPSYVLTVFADGRITYEGRHFVKVRGSHWKTIPTAKLAPLFAKLDAVHFWKFKDSYYVVVNPDGSIEAVTDQPTYTVTVKTGGQTKRVVDYYGAPKALRELEDLIDTTAGVEEWIGKPDERKR